MCVASSITAPCFDGNYGMQIYSFIPIPHQEGFFFCKIILAELSTCTYSSFRADREFVVKFVVQGYL